jgi:hypothetical protein
LGGLLAGVTVSGVLMGMFQSNAGGAWDNAKKSFEKGVEINGQVYYKKSEPHKASVTGDTVGDPFKDTSGPSMNILIKLMSIVALVIAPHISVSHGHGETKVNEEKIEVIQNNGQMTATITTNSADADKVVQMMILPDGNAKVVTTETVVIDGKVNSNTKTEVRPLTDLEKKQFETKQ